jgi:hypothetical protein
MTRIPADQHGSDIQICLCLIRANPRFIRVIRVPFALMIFGPGVALARRVGLRRTGDRV